MARIVTYATKCPTCLVEGVSRVLGFDPQVGGISCDAPEPHIFDSLPGAESVPECPPTQAETQQTPEVPAGVEGSGESEQKRFSELVSERAKVADTPLAEQNAAIAKEYGIDLENLPPLPEGTDPGPGSVTGSVTVTKQPGDTFTEYAGITRDGSAVVGERGKATLAGGDVLFGLRISEQWVSAIAAAAENAGQSFGDYLQDYFNNTALLNEWSDAPAAR